MMYWCVALQSRIGELVQLQRQIDGVDNLVCANRELRQKGKIHVISVKTGRRERMAFLVSYF